ncbi:MAG: 50S ribosomal protein L11 methyltransferase, partial [Candidatus Eisenbacteria sp.]|nr:50S ribosomal protein L11 methyltransferase [Candidatus Eisenbacteria bacterium]
MAKDSPLEPPASNPKTYVEVILQVDQRETETAEAALLELGALGTALEIPRRAQAGPPQVVGYFQPDTVPEASEILKQFHLLRPLYNAAIQFRARQQPSPATPQQPSPATQPLSAPAVQIQTRPWLDWAGQARASFRPFQATPDLQIAPPWNVPAEPSGDLLVLHPGAAFGLGSHATTRGCLAFIPPAASDIPRGSALDVGTGTGLLGLRAAQCGFNPVIACDNDPLAVA